MSLRFSRFAGAGIWLRQESLRHILASPGTIAVNVTWMERGFNACQTHRSIYPSIFNRLRAIARYWSEIATFPYPLAFSAPCWGVPIGIPGKSLDLRKLESWITRQWRQFDDRLSRFVTIPACDRRTDRRTSSYSYNVRRLLKHFKNPKTKPYETKLTLRVTTSSQEIHRVYSNKKQPQEPAVSWESYENCAYCDRVRSSYGEKNSCATRSWLVVVHIAHVTNA